ncbi:grasp-with-spasm system SPASM domain peptide maturase [Flavobacterium sp.]|uniref:grasp-with-spasm system SPASM domain peptide maturase n=1 Tax=Flavobacterium sp. TaxID=239 RepID=UPI000EBA77B2|nr:grasp-with-spasm system SPASM domain peptide maturase [Flavobacterium sp.]HCQ13986.1 grasp-with-spasm system SPASM domain peptide maturase [Flavobacterium sp.]
MKNKYLKVFSNCIVSKGSSRSLILDIQRESFIAIPDTFEEFINLIKQKKSLIDIYKIYGIENKIVINEYIDFLLENEYGFICENEEFDNFIDMDYSFEFPAHITNCIIEFSKKTSNNLDMILNGLDKLMCNNVQFIIYDQVSIEELIELLVKTKDLEVKGIELIIEYSELFLDFISKIDKINFRVVSITIYNSKDKPKYQDDTTFSINYIDKKIDSFKHCGAVETFYFNINKLKVLESINHNSCLNKKISIDKDGNIKNCPSMPQSFGNIKDTTLEEALNHPDFKKYWNVNKDMIVVCKDCEFRHICTDCRAYTERTDFEGDIDLSKPLKCGYNSYTNEWAEWSTNPLKQKAIEYYGMQDLVKKD